VGIGARYINEVLPGRSDNAPVRRSLLIAMVATCLSVSGCAGNAAVTTSSSFATPSRSVPGSDPSEVRPDVCDAVGASAPVGEVTDPGLTEISGVVYSQTLPGVLWAHNDSGAPPWLWAVAPDGVVLGHHEIDARNVDWEDVALGPGSGPGWWVYLADTGDNFGRRDSVRLIRFPEPGSASGTIDEVETLEVRYPDGPEDAEALLVDPLTGDGYIITKSDSGVATVLSVPVDAWDGGQIMAQPVARLDFGEAEVVTAADISSDGLLIALRTYGDVWLWSRQANDTVDSALLGRPCRAPASDEPQGEAVALDARGYAMIGEGAGSILYRSEGW
jgi:hypothetical protein